MTDNSELPGRSRLTLDEAIEQLRHATGATPAHIEIAERDRDRWDELHRELTR